MELNSAVKRQNDTSAPSFNRVHDLIPNWIAQIDLSSDETDPAAQTDEIPSTSSCATVNRVVSQGFVGINIRKINPLVEISQILNQVPPIEAKPPEHSDPLPQDRPPPLPQEFQSRATEVTGPQRERDGGEIPINEKEKRGPVHSRSSRGRCEIAAGAKGEDEVQDRDGKGLHPGIVRPSHDSAPKVGSRTVDSNVNGVKKEKSAIDDVKDVVGRKADALDMYAPKIQSTMFQDEDDEENVHGGLKQEVSSSSDSDEELILWARDQPQHLSDEDASESTKSKDRPPTIRPHEADRQDEEAVASCARVNKDESFCSNPKESTSSGHRPRRPPGGEGDLSRGSSHGDSAENIDGDYHPSRTLQERPSKEAQNGRTSGDGTSPRVGSARDVKGRENVTNTVPRNLQKGEAAYELNRSGQDDRNVKTSRRQSSPSSSSSVSSSHSSYVHDQYLYEAYFRDREDQRKNGDPQSRNRNSRPSTARCVHEEEGGGQRPRERWSSYGPHGVSSGKDGGRGDEGLGAPSGGGGGQWGRALRGGNRNRGGDFDEPSGYRGWPPKEREGGKEQGMAKDSRHRSGRGNESEKGEGAQPRRRDVDVHLRSSASSKGQGYSSNSRPTRSSPNNSNNFAMYGAVLNAHGGAGSNAFNGSRADDKYGDSFYRRSTSGNDSSNDGRSSALRSRPRSRSNGSRRSSFPQKGRSVSRGRSDVSRNPSRGRTSRSVASDRSFLSDRSRSRPRQPGGVAPRYPPCPASKNNPSHRSELGCSSSQRNPSGSSERRNDAPGPVMPPRSNGYQDRSAVQDRFDGTSGGRRSFCPPSRTSGCSDAAVRHKSPQALNDAESARVRGPGGRDPRQVGGEIRKGYGAEWRGGREDEERRDGARKWSRGFKENSGRRHTDFESGRGYERRGNYEEAMTSRNVGSADKRPGFPPTDVGFSQGRRPIAYDDNCRAMGRDSRRDYRVDGNPAYPPPPPNLPVHAGNRSNAQGSGLTMLGGQGPSRLDVSAPPFTPQGQVMLVFAPAPLFSPSYGHFPGPSSFTSCGVGGFADHGPRRKPMLTDNTASATQGTAAAATQSTAASATQGMAASATRSSTAASATQSTAVAATQITAVPSSSSSGTDGGKPNTDFVVVPRNVLLGSQGRNQSFPFRDFPRQGVSLRRN